MACPHVGQILQLSPPKLSQSVNREECTQCFDNQDSADGIDVCLTCFNGGCLGAERHHARTHFEKSGHSFTLNVKRKAKAPPRRESDEPPAKMTKLAILEEREEDKYEHETIVKCWSCNASEGTKLTNVTDAKVKELTDGVMQSMSSGRQAEVKAWEEEIIACEHTVMLQQENKFAIQPSGLANCQKCDLKENLWLCLTCGSLGCGRQQFGGLGGNGHGLQHYEETRHPVSVKLGTITSEGTADIYCYQCNDARVDPELAAHLANFGININTQTKTEKSMSELQIEHNLKYDFSMTADDGKALEPLYGPGLTGLSNLGNSCYMASVTQVLFSLPSFQARYLSSAAEHSAKCAEPLPASCVECQMHKLADGLLSGRYAHPRSHSSGTVETTDSAPVPTFQDGLKPATFKSLIGKGHAEFATMRQQDAEEFFVHLLQVLRRDARRVQGSDAGAVEPTEVFRFGLEQRLQCGTCLKVRYRVDEEDVLSLPVPAIEKGKDAEGKQLYEDVQLDELLTMFTAEDTLEYNCPSCSKSVIAARSSKFATFPDVLVIHAKKFQLVNWVPTKLDIPIILPQSDELSLDQLLARGLQQGEEELPNDSAPASAAPAFNEAAMAQLEGMGFPTVRCQKALLATGNDNAEAAMEWLFAHMDDPDIDAPIQTTSSSGGAPEPSAEQVSMLADMGFTAAQAKKALRETGGDTERAVDWLFNHPDDMGDTDAPSTSAPTEPKPTSTTTAGSSKLPAKYKLKAFISHKGPSVHSGHYIAHIRFADGWVMFNDEKVVRADDDSVKELKQLAYLYVFERV
ncbi:ubiquitinyl hydrolase [Schizopora paradoxa]|uniref:Ubiquitin carboxyl-terminal hydrolase n=1 Tax=Schizopora paradoxa TaxID=27342 RepID=A0A0H2S626_9AGAM|nr:ubiquitinyl hydrolase [Schizopora paradoxa]